MKFISACIIVGVILVGCGSSHQDDKADTPPVSDPQHPPPHNTITPTSIAPNVSQVEAVVENVEYIDETQFNVGIFIVSSTPVAGRTSIVEAGQRLVVSPQYVRDPSGGMDMANDTNKRLMAIRLKQYGQSFKGKIVINRQGGWNLVDVDQQQ